MFKFSLSQKNQRQFISPCCSSCAMQKSERLVLRLAIFSRFLLISLIITWRFLFPPYDSSAQINPSCLSSPSTADDLSHFEAADRVLWPRVGAAIEGSVVWDSVYFVRIAQCGYEYEQTYAFLPLLPLSISLLSRSVFAPLIPVIGYRAVLALSGYVLNNIAFVLAAIYFYKLSFLILKDSAASLQASVLFCFNPASIFYSSIYSESLYALFSLCGLFYLFSGSNYVAILLLGVCGTARSNGAIHAGYFCFKALLQAYDGITNKNSIGAIVGGAAYSICLFVPFAAFQVYGYYNICVCASDGLRPWCNSRVPNLYGYLQSHYWGVGFLRYFEVKQLPNFLLASPILAIAIASVIYYASLLQQTLQSFRMTSDSMTDPQGKDHCQEIIYSDNSSASVEFKAFTSYLSIWWIPGITFQGNIFAFGYSQILSKPLIYFSFIIKEYECSETGNHILQRRKSAYKANASEKFHFAKHEMDSFIKFKQGYCSVLVFPFILHLGFMTFMAFFVMHVQVATRFLSASPPIYWFASYVMLSPGTTSRRVGHVIWSYSIAYILLGSLLFSNFYPFT